MAKWVKWPAAKLDNLGSIPWTHRVGGTNSPKLTSDLYVCTKAHKCLHMHTPTQGLRGHRRDAERKETERDRKLETLREKMGKREKGSEGVF